MSRQFPTNDENKQRITFINQQGEKLAGNFYQPPGETRSGVVFGHCFTCTRHTRILIDSCETLFKNGIASLRFDFSGNGQSEGEFASTTYSKNIQEMEAAIQFMVDQGITNIGLAGHSMGAIIALLTASRKENVRAVCTLAGRYTGTSVSGLLTEKNKTALAQAGQINFESRGRSLVLTADFFKDGEKYNLPEIVAMLGKPLLAVHGGKDELIPVSEVQQSKQYKPKQTEIFTIHDADHMFSNEQHRHLISLKLADWFKKTLADQSDSSSN